MIIPKIIANFDLFPVGLVRFFSKNPKPKSALKAIKAAGIAPAKINSLLTVEIPRKINTPKPPPPIAAAIVAIPTDMTVATLTPAKITGKARGISTFNNNCWSVIPIPIPASLIAELMLLMPI